MTTSQLYGKNDSGQATWGGRGGSRSASAEGRQEESVDPCSGHPRAPGHRQPIAQTGRQRPREGAHPHSLDLQDPDMSLRLFLYPYLDQFCSFWGGGWSPWGQAAHRGPMETQAHRAPRGWEAGGVCSGTRLCGGEWVCSPAVQVMWLPGDRCPQGGQDATVSPGSVATGRRVRGTQGGLQRLSAKGAWWDGVQGDTGVAPAALM